MEPKYYKDKLIIAALKMSNYENSFSESFINLAQLTVNRINENDHENWPKWLNLLNSLYSAAKYEGFKKK